MSLNSLADAAYARRTDSALDPRIPSSNPAPDPLANRDENGGPSPLGVPAAPEPPKPTKAPASPAAATSVDTAIKVLFGYIPTEVLTVYVAVIAAVQKPAIATADWIAFASFFCATPVVVWLLFAAKVKAAGKPLPTALSAWPTWEMSAATMAYTAWAFGLPHSPFTAFAWYSAAISGLAVIIVSTALGLVAPFFQRPLAS